MVKRKIDWTKILLAFLIANFIFFFGIFLGFVSKGFLSSQIKEIEESARNEILDLETISLIEEDFKCNEEILEITTKKLDSLGQLLTILEDQKGKTNPVVLNLKKLYTIIEIRHMFLIKKRNIECNKNNSIIIYFYSNEKECEKEIKKVSFILTHLKRKNPSVMIYSIDLNLESDLVKILKSEYNVKKCYKVLINEKPFEDKINNYEQLENFIQNKNP